MFNKQYYRKVSPETKGGSNKVSINEIRRLFSYLNPYKFWMIGAISATSVGAALGLVFPWILRNLVDAVFTNGNINELNRITLLLIGTFLLRSLFLYFQSYALTFVGERIITDLRNEVYNHLYRLSIRFFSDRRVGELISRLASDITLVRTVLTNNIATVMSQSIMFIGSLVLMLILNWRLTIFILIIAPFVAISAVFFGRKMRRLSTSIQDNVADSSATAEEALSNIRVVKAFTREPFEVKRYALHVEKIFQTTMQMAKYKAAFGPLIMFLAFSSLAAILWFGGREVLADRLTGGALIAFLVYGINIAASVGSFSSLYTQFQEAAGASHRIFELIDEEPDIKNKPNAKILPPIAQEIRFENVSFSYPDSHNVLHKLNLVIHTGEVLALVGPSGAGKTTLFNLIPRFYDPTEGYILIDSNDIRDVTVESLRNQIGLVPQEIQLFSGSIYENIKYGKLTATEEEVYQAAIAANADEFIQKLPNGYKTLVGERGIKISGGQRQRISIARAILKNPQILLLDEATSNLDTESERLVQDALDHLLFGRTTIIIAHRLSTVHKANRIAVLNDGYLIELGNHTQLMEKNGLYAKLYRLQFEERRREETKV